VCYRLWAEGTHQYLAAHRTPEIMEADLSPLMLDLFHWGVKDISTLVWLSSPPPGSVSQAKEILSLLGAVKDDRITEHGKKLAKIPAHPRIAQMMLKAKEEQLLSVALDVAAILEEKDFLSKEQGASIDLRLEILRNWRRGEKVSADKHALERIEKVIKSWRKIFSCKEDNERVSGKVIGKLIAAAYPERIAKKVDQGFYKLSNGRKAKLRDHDVLILEEWLAVAHLDAGSGEGKIFLAAALDPSDAEHLTEEKHVLKWDNQKGTIVSQREKRIGAILLHSVPSDFFSIEDKNNLLLDVIKSEGKKLLTWNEETETFQARVNSLKIWRPEEQWPDTTTEYLLAHPHEWLLPYIDSVRKSEDFKKLDLKNILTGILSWPLQQKLNELAPEKIQVPSGSSIPLQYFQDGRSPILAVRLQEVFGLLETPVINESRTKVLMHLLSPGYKPVQVTQDLKSFWKNTYPAVRKELRVRYQKHHWPEDPWTAEAVRGVKRKNKD
jgi:ATP-dependent helicase HrpB